jgi:hypothetical protein
MEANELRQLALDRFNHQGKAQTIVHLQRLVPYCAAFQKESRHPHESSANIQRCHQPERCTFIVVTAFGSMLMVGKYHSRVHAKQHHLRC